MAAFAISDTKVGKDLHEAILAPPNCFSRLNPELPPSGVTVRRGITDSAEIELVAQALGEAEDLVENENTKGQSKLNALGSDKVQLAPLGYLPQLESHKIAHLNVEAQGWGETAVSLDVRLKVNDPGGGAGVNIDLVRIAAAALRSGRGGYPAEAASLVKSPPGAAV